MLCTNASICLVMYFILAQSQNGRFNNSESHSSVKYTAALQVRYAGYNILYYDITYIPTYTYV